MNTDSLSSPPLTLLRRSWAQKREFWVCLLLALSVAAVFWPVTHAAFINYDDPEYITENSHVQAGVRWEGVLWAFRTYHASNWHPLTWLSHMLDVELFGRGAAGPHCVNLLLHTANTVLLFLCLRRMTGAHWRSLVVAALFALHPLHVESVAWVAERKDVLSTFFGVLTLLAYGRYVAEKEGGGWRAGGGAGDTSGVLVARAALTLHASLWYVSSLVCFTLGLMSKPMLVTLPFVMLLVDGWPLGRFDFYGALRNPAAVFAYVREKIPFLFLSALACWATVLAQQGALQPLVNIPLGDRIDNALVSYLRYLGKMFWPVGLAVPYPHAHAWTWTVVVIAAAVLAALSVGALWLGRRFPFALTGWFWFFGTLVPVIGLVQVGSQSMADRYSYLPLVGLFILLTWGMAEVACRWGLPRVATGAVAVAVLVACGGLTWRQAGYWHDNERLFHHAVAVTEGNYVALTSIGVSLFHQGKFKEAMEYYQRALAVDRNYTEALNNIGVVLAAQGSEEAIEWYREALRLNPRHAGVLYNLGNEFAKRKRYADAIACFEAVLRASPDHYEALNNLGNALVELGRIDEAMPYYRQALRVDTGDVKIRKNLAAALVKQGKMDEAITHYQQAVHKEPNNASTHYALGLALALRGKWDEAIGHYQETLRLIPDHPEAQYNLGYALRVQGRLDEAAAHLLEALRLRPEFPLADYNLGCVLAEQGRREEAVAHLRQALRLQPDYKEAKQKLAALESSLDQKQEERLK